MSECESPVASFAGTSGSLRGDDDLRDALKHGAADETIASHAERLRETDMEASRVYLTIQVFERSSINEADVCEAQGIPFVMGDWLREKLDGATLEYINRDEFSLVADDGTKIELF